MKQLGLVLEPEAAPRRRRSAVLRSFHISSPGGHASVPEALEGERKAQRQEERVLEWMRSHPGKWTPWEVSEALGMFVVSCRRALTNLAVSELLIHDPRTRRHAGPYGSKSSTWEAKWDHKT